ncbi:MAG: serine--tRNA ligase [Candidatus Paracaedibacteraceae bacterium]|nr:serine--tRNA ligase [Candidatus Paracaedibacteraceae bacterium]
MHDIRFIRSLPDQFDESLARRGLEPQSAHILDIDTKLRQIQTELQDLQTRRNQIAKEFGIAKKNGLDTSDLTSENEITKAKMATLEAEMFVFEKDLHFVLSHLPNLPATECPDGKDESENVEIRRHGLPRVFDFTPKQHFELGESLKMMDFERAAKMSGSRFVVLTGQLARLERAIAQFMLDTHTTEFGYTETYVPLLVHDAALFGVGHLPKFAEDMFKTTTGHWLTSTSEVTLTNLVSGEILAESELPLRFTSYSQCFRSEAGSAGKDTRGMIRQHQFSKVELVSIILPEQAAIEHERMTDAAETILKKLGLPFRTLALCTGDMGFSAEKTYDLEVWLPGQNAYREISSCSRCNEFQARRMNTRYKSKADGKNYFVHTLNGSGLAVGRTMVAILENYQQADGSITIPDVLVPYMGGVTVISLP